MAARSVHIYPSRHPTKGNKRTFCATSWDVATGGLALVASKADDISTLIYPSTRKDKRTRKYKDETSSRGHLDIGEYTCT